MSQASRIKRIVILANSRMLSGRCIAGREWRGGTAGPWVRPVSAGENHAIHGERLYEDGGDPRVLDVVDIPLLKPHPIEHQRENWLLDRHRRWKKVDTLSWRDLHKLADPTEQLWTSGHSTYHGGNDRVPLSLAASARGSLRLVHVKHLRLSVFTDSYSRKRVQGRFKHFGNHYRLWVTDPEYERPYLDKPDGEYDIGESFLTISLGLPFTDDYCYKLIAAVIQ